MARVELAPALLFGARRLMLQMSRLAGGTALRGDRVHPALVPRRDALQGRRRGR